MLGWRRKKGSHLEAVFRDDNRKVFIEFDQIEATGNYDGIVSGRKCWGLNTLRDNESEEAEMVHTRLLFGKFREGSKGTSRYYSRQDSHRIQKLLRILPW